MEQMLATFGPLAFGAVVALVMWSRVVKPEIDALREDTARHSEKNHEIARNMASTAQSCSHAAGCCERSISELRGIIETTKSFHRE